MATAPSVSYSMTIRLEVPSSGTSVSQLTTAVESSGGTVTGLDVTASGHERVHHKRRTEVIGQLLGRRQLERLVDRCE